jgi:hypothetical protein
MRPDASENSQISCSTIVRAARAAGSHPHLASVLQQGRKSANICVSLGVIRGIPVHGHLDAEALRGMAPGLSGIWGPAITSIRSGGTLNNKKADSRAELERLMANFKGETKICPPVRTIAPKTKTKRVRRKAPNTIETARGVGEAPISEDNDKPPNPVAGNEQLRQARCPGWTGGPGYRSVALWAWLGCAMAAHENLAGGLIGGGGALFAAWLAGSVVREQIQDERRRDN